MPLKALKIQNIILVDHAEIEFESGFTVISGETGSGKSAVLEALQLVLGSRGDTSLIRQGCEKAIAEAVIELTQNHPAIALLESKGIECEDSAVLILKRELGINGKSRGFINHQPAQISLLKELGDLLFEIVTQNASQKLLSPDHHRTLLDLYGGLRDQAADFERKWQEQQALSFVLDELKRKLPQKLRECETCSREIEEIEEARLKEEEEESLFAEYSLLTSSEERSSLSDQVERTLGSERGILVQLKSLKAPLQKLLQLEPAFSSEWEQYQSLTLEAEELLHTIRQYKLKAEADPERLQHLNERLTLISKMKKKYGASLEEIQNYLRDRKTALIQWEALDEEIALKEEALSNSLKLTLEAAEALQKSREKAAASFQIQVTKELRALNMKHAELKVEFTPQPLHRHGAYKIEFHLSANKGEPFLPLKEAASGGEMARVLLAIQLILAGKEPLETLIFDEIDSSIGGTTAALIGEKFQQLGRSLQVFAITHFPQVAKYGDQHLHISKAESAGRTRSSILPLTDKNREKELARMAGQV